MRKIVILNDYGAFMPESFINAVKGEFVLETLSLDVSEDVRLQSITEAEIIIGEPTVEELENAKNLRWLQMTWAGIDRYCHGGFPKDVLLTNASGAFGQTIAEHALGMLLALCRRLGVYAKTNQWKDLGSEIFVSGSSAMIFGTGDIGSNIAKRLKAFDVNMIGVCRNTDRQIPGFDRLISLEEAENYLPEADFILCAMPETTETREYLNARRFEKIKDGAILVNVGRGSFVDTQALCEALTRGKLFAAGLDVVHPEPLPQDHLLWSMENVLITPHVAGIGFGHLPGTAKKIWEICTENLLRYKRGEPLRNLADITSSGGAAL